MSQPEVLSPTNDGDRRRAPRRNLLESHMSTASLGHGGTALILDLSETGLGVQSVGGLQAGAGLAIRFTLPESGAVIEAGGRVAWSDASGRAGVHFDSLDAEVRQALKDSFVEAELLPMPAAVTGPAADAVSTVRAYLAGAALEVPSALDYIARQSASLTQADGAAIALTDDSGMVCRASVGAAPGVGVRLKGSGGLTGECVQTAQVIRVDDTETDPRADRLLCRRINLRSTVIVPILGGNDVLGVLETLSSRPRAFNNDHVAVLRGLAELVATTARPGVNHALPSIASILEPSLEPVPGRCDVCGKRNAISDAACARCGASLHPPAAPVTAAPAKPQAAPLVPLPVEKVVAPAAPLPPVAPAVAPAPPKTSLPDPSATAQAAAPRPPATIAAATVPVPPPPPRKPAEPKPVVTRAAASTAAAAVPVLAPEPLATSIAPYPAAAEVRKAIQTAQPTAVESAPASQAPGGFSISLRRPWVVAVVCAIALAFSAGWGYFLSRSRQAAVAPGSAKVIAAAPAPAAPAPAAAQLETKPAETAARQAATAVPQPGAPSASAAALHTVPAAQRRPLAPGLTLRTPETQPPAQPAAAAAVAPPSLPQSQREVLSLPAVATSVPIVAATSPATSSLVQAKLVRRVNPVYPELARRIGVQGEVRIDAVVGTDGKLKDIRVLSGPPVLRNAALQALRNWLYEPGSLNGKPVDTSVGISINFQLPRQ